MTGGEGGEQQAVTGGEGGDQQPVTGDFTNESSEQVNNGSELKKICLLIKDNGRCIDTQTDLLPHAAVSK